MEGQSFDSLRFLSGFSYLKELNLNDCKFPADDLNIIANLPALRRLTLSDCNLSTCPQPFEAQQLFCPPASYVSSENLALMIRCPFL